MKRVLALLLDAASPDLIEKWTDDGSLPNLRRLRQGGAYGRLSSVADTLAEGTHFAFHSGRHPAATGLVGYSVWQKETMRSRTPSPEWLPATPFWRLLTDSGPRAVVVDPACVYAPEPFHGTEIVGWATHDALTPFQSYPPEVADRIHGRFGSCLLHDESYALMTRREFMNTANLLREINRKFKGLCLELMQSETWDLFLACNYTLHHAGHRLWSTVNVTDALSAAQKTEMQGALRQAYVDCDEMVGGILEAAGADTRILVFSLHGMGVNHSRTHIFPEMLRRITSEHPSSTGLLKRLRELVPQRWRHEVKSRLPFDMRRRLTSYWRMSEYEWESTRAFSLLSDTEAWVRINLKGRELRGIVEQGADYEALCTGISEGVRSFVDADTGEPLVSDVLRPQQVFKGERLADLPDLIVRWVPSPAAGHRAVISPRYGTVAWPTPGQNPEGRSGNHRPQGMLIAAGPDARPDPIEGAHILDLAPTILSLLDQPIPGIMEGRPLHLFG